MSGKFVANVEYGIVSKFFDIFRYIRVLLLNLSLNLKIRTTSVLFRLQFQLTADAKFPVSMRYALKFSTRRFSSNVFIFKGNNKQPLIQQYLWLVRKFVRVNIEKWVQKFFPVCIFADFPKNS